jgi:hypothetical protein
LRIAARKRRQAALSSNGARIQLRSMALALLYQ